MNGRSIAVMTVLMVIKGTGEAVGTGETGVVNEVQTSLVVDKTTNRTPQADVKSNVFSYKKKYDIKYNSIEKILRKESLPFSDSERRILIQELQSIDTIVRNDARTDGEDVYVDALNRLIIFKERVNTVLWDGCERVKNPVHALSVLRNAKTVEMRFYGLAQDGAYTINEIIEHSGRIKKICNEFSVTEFNLNEDYSYDIRENSSQITYSGDSLALIVDRKHLIAFTTFETMMCRYDYAYETADGSFFRRMVRIMDKKLIQEQLEKNGLVSEKTSEETSAECGN